MMFLETSPRQFRRRAMLCLVILCGCFQPTQAMFGFGWLKKKISREPGSAEVTEPGYEMVGTGNVTPPDEYRAALKAYYDASKKYQAANNEYWLDYYGRLSTAREKSRADKQCRSRFDTAIKADAAARLKYARIIPGKSN